jgi:hypothetical protein
MSLFRFNALLICALGALSPAQIIGVELTQDARRSYSKWLLEKNGRLMICGDPVEGFEWKPDKDTLTRLGVKKVVIRVPDPAKPEAPLGPNRLVTIATDDLQKHDLLLRHETCEGLRTEYLRKKERLEAARKMLTGPKPGSPQWFVAQRALLAEIDTLALWLRSTFFPVAAQKLEKEYGAEVKRQSAVASEARLEAAKKVSPVEIPESLPLKTREFGGGEQGWHGRETQHLRIIAHQAVTDAALETALNFGERVIEGYRTQFVDPFLGPDDADPVPEGRIAELVLVPDHEDLANKLYEGWLGRSLGHPRDRTSKMKGHRGRSGLAFHEFWRFGAEDDLEGIVAHGLGHDLASFHFARGGTVPAWVDEGLAYWVSFEYLSRNTVTCFAFSLPAGYTRVADKEGEKKVERGMRAAFNEAALTKGPPLSDLLRMKLVEMTGADFAKSWSVVDYLLTAHKPKLQKLLRAAGAATDGEGRTNLETFRKTCEELFPGAPGRDVYTEIDSLWKQFASTTQKSGGKG